MQIDTQMPRIRRVRCCCWLWWWWWWCVWQNSREEILLGHILIEPFEYILFVPSYFVAFLTCDLLQHFHTLCHWKLI